MARVTVEDCIDKVESPYELVLVAKERTTQLNSGVEPTVSIDNDKNTVISLREIAKENVKVEAASQTYATITLQNYFRMYHKLAGMTGTAETEAKELWDIYKLDVVVVKTNKPIIRNDQNDLVYKTAREKYQAIIKEVENILSLIHI